jgi:Zn-dependent protease with chaperone function
MDFFERQDDARKKTKLLVFYFILAVVGVVVSIYALVVFGLSFTGKPQGSGGYRSGRPPAKIAVWQPDVFLSTAGGVLIVVLLGSGFKSLSLSAGGSAVAKELGGRRIDQNTTDADERKLMNVVEEMAIAAGVPVPEVYLMENESGINAFAAGRTPSDAVIGVTRGCVKLLSRDELQGVIAHEFSHILNGDMRLNLRLIGLLFGILMLSILGRIILRSSMYSGGSRSSDGKGNGAFPIMLFGLGLTIIGSIGVLFGHLIKSAVSRQREFLADASAVQFTRNPDGIGGALKKIGGLAYGSRIEDPHAEEASHMFFANGLKASFSEAFATHPPLAQRIKAIDPSWDGKFERVNLPSMSSSMGSRDNRSGQRPRGDTFGFENAGTAGLSGLIARAIAAEERTEPAPKRPPATAGAPMKPPTAGATIASIGRLDDAQIAMARQIHADFPDDWLRAVRNESGAQALVFALLLAQDDDLRSGELEFLARGTDSLTYQTTLFFHGQLGDLHSSRKLALVDLGIPALRRLSPQEYQRFIDLMQHLISSDRKVNLFEFTLQKIVKRHLDLYFRRTQPPRIRYQAFAPLADDAAVLLSTLAFLGAKEEADALAAFRAGAATLESEIGGRLEVKPGNECGLPRIDEALDRFDAAAPMVKKKLLHACGTTVMADGKVVSDEAELLRAIADTIGCPIPPFIQEA